MAARAIKVPRGNNELYDAGRRHVLAEKIQPLPEDLKKKISIILEAIPTRRKSEIAEVLQSCDYDVDRALNHFLAGGDMETQSEWKVQGRKKNRKKKKSGKKPSTENNEDQSLGTSQIDSKDNATSSVRESKQSEQEKSRGIQPEQQNAGSQPTTGTEPSSSSQANEMRSFPDKKEDMMVIKKDAATLENDESKDQEIKSAESCSPSPPLLSPTDSVKSSPDSQALDKGKAVPDKHPRVRTQSTSGPEVIKKSLKDLQRSSVSIARFQSMVDAQADSSTKTLAESFRALRKALDEREKFLEQQLEGVVSETRNLLESRQVNAADLKFKCNRVGTMSEEEVNELRNEMKHFVGERRIDEDLGKTIRFLRDEEKMIEAIKNFGEVTPIKNYYTPYQKKHPEPVKAKPDQGKPFPLKTLHAPDNKTHDKPGSSNGTTTSNSRKHENPVLSPSRLKDQAEMHARLKEVVKQQAGAFSMDKKHTPRADEKPKPKDFGGKNVRYNSGKQSFNDSRRQHTPYQNRQDNSRNFVQNSSKSTNGPVQSLPNGANSSGETGEKNEKSGKNEKENPFERNKGTTNSEHPNHHPGPHRTKRRYIRRTPLDGTNGSPSAFTKFNGHGKEAGEKSSNESGTKREPSNEDQPVGHQQGQNSMVNGSNGFIPLPQRNPRRRTMYYKKDPEAEIKFPPPKENGSLNNSSSRQPSEA